MFSEKSTLHPSTPDRLKYLALIVSSAGTCEASSAPPPVGSFALLDAAVAGLDAGSPVPLGDPRAVIVAFSYEFQVIGHAGDIEYAKEIFRRFQICG